ncbi:hypothetical protein BGZ58_007115 [Dissophora ornata]|nr:hypothetical protein BGZ58_007115 [Dissophora ornata]
MTVSVYDEGKRNELIGEGVLLLHEVIDKGELDVWFPVKYQGTAGGDIYFELTFYAAAPPVAGATPPIPQAQIQTPIRHAQPGYQAGAPGAYGSPAVAPSPYHGSMYQAGYNANTRPFVPQQSFPAATTPYGGPPVTPPYGGPPAPTPYGGSPATTPYGGPPAPAPGFNQQFPYRPAGASPYPVNATPQVGNSGLPGGYPNQMPQMPQPFNGGPGGPGGNSYPPNSNTNNNNNNVPGRFPVAHSSPGIQHMNAGPGFLP